MRGWIGVTASPDFRKFAAVTQSSEGSLFQSGDAGVTWTNNGAVGGVLATTSGTTSVDLCPPGMYSQTGNTGCTLCAAGTYSTVSGATACLACGAADAPASVFSSLCQSMC